MVCMYIDEGAGALYSMDWHLLFSFGVCSARDIYHASWTACILMCDTVKILLSSTMSQHASFGEVFDLRSGHKLICSVISTTKIAYLYKNS